MTDLGASMGMDQVKAKAAVLEMAEKECRQAMTLFAYQPKDTLSERYPGLVHRPDEYVAIRHCQCCNPPPKVYTCPLCDWETEDQWRMKVHVAYEPEWCQMRARKKERTWASKA